MDYGYRMLRHVVAQVFGNLGQAARLTLVPTFLPLIILIVLMPDLGMGLMGPADPFASTTPVPDEALGSSLLALLTFIVVSVVGYCWAAVGWHRFVLLEEFGRGVVPSWHGNLIMSYLGRAFLIGLLTIAVAIAGMIVVGILTAAFQSVTIIFVLMTGFILGLTWMITRVGLILPAAALGQQMSMRESWAETRPVASHILVPLLFISIGMTILGQLVIFIFGASMLAIIPNAVMYWIQVLLNLSLMTTLYGTQVEGRPLN